MGPVVVVLDQDVIEHTKVRLGEFGFGKVFLTHLVNLLTDFSFNFKSLGDLLEPPAGAANRGKIHMRQVLILEDLFQNFWWQGFHPFLRTPLRVMVSYKGQSSSKSEN